MCTINDQQVERQATDGEESESLDRDDNTKITPIEDVQNHIEPQQWVQYTTKLHQETLRTIPRLAMSK